MYKFAPILILCYIVLIVYIISDVGKVNATATTHHRPKRFLAFINKTHAFLKFNVKANMVPWNQLFAQAVGFRMNWDVPPPDDHPFKRFYRRDVYSHAEILLNKIGLNGFHCVRRAVCELKMISNPDGIYHKLLKIVFRKISSSTEKWHNTTKEDCYASVSECPFSMLDVATYTDIV